MLGVVEPGQFTGELSLLFGQTAFADCIAVTEGEVLLVAPKTVIELVPVYPEVSDVLLPAFAARRLLLIQRQQGALTANVMGAKYATPEFGARPAVQVH